MIDSLQSYTKKAITISEDETRTGVDSSKELPSTGEKHHL
jgi:hypothetical protein